MQYLRIDNSMKLSELADVVGNRNVESMLVNNGLSRTPYVGAAFQELCDNTIQTTPEVNWQRKSTILNQLSQDSDVFETAALLGSSGWKLLSSLGTFPNMLKVPESVVLQDSTAILGNGEGVPTEIYTQAMYYLKTPPHQINPAIFNEYSHIVAAQTLEYRYNDDIFQAFKIPWGSVSLYSSLSRDSVDFPVYPEEVSDGAKANFTTMPDLLYQYEPWQIYSSSGPRSNSYTFDFHRDMWTGDHRDGKANDLIRFCTANCYPDYNGSAVNIATVSLYVAGSLLISGILTDVSVEWDGPLGLDGWYLHCKLTLSITEVSTQPLNYNSVRRKPLIG